MSGQWCKYWGEKGNTQESMQNLACFMLPGVWQAFEKYQETVLQYIDWQNELEDCKYFSHLA